MPIEFHCNQCHRLLRVPDAAAGKQAKCPGCAAVVAVPSGRSQAPLGPPLQAPPAAPGAAPIPPAGAAPPGPPAAAENPYAAPRTTQFEPSYQTSGRRPRSGMVTAVAIVNLVMGGLQLLCGAVFTFGSGFIAALPEVRRELQNDDEFVQIVFVVLGIFVMVFGGLSVLAGYGVLKRRQWGRILTLVLGGFHGLSAILNCVSLSPAFVVNAAYAIFVFVVLLNSRNAAEFS